MKHERGMKQLKLATNVLRANLAADPTNVEIRRAMAELICSAYVLAQEAMSMKICPQRSCEFCREYLPAVDELLRPNGETSDEED